MTREATPTEYDEWLAGYIEGATETDAGLEMPTYSIVRFHQNGNWETIRMGLTLAEAQEHCQRDDTHGEDWFDGYRED